VFAGGFALRGVVDDDAVTTSTTSANKGTTVPVDLSSDEPAAEVARVLGPAVVQIERGDGLGSGVIYDASGLILTNAHVVGDARSVDVRLADGTLLEGRVLGADEGRDLAVVAVDATGDLPVAELALGEELTVGQVAVAVGSPFGLQQSVTMGIVSATDRPVEGSEVLIGMVQTDAPINPGNSGGALADRSGRVIGVNASIYSEDGENNGIGFAIPIDIAVETARRIVEGESLAVARIGVESDTEGPSDGSPGALVGMVRWGGAADDAGISKGDVIVGVEDRPVISFEDLAVKIGAHFPGDTISVEVKSDGKVRTVEVTLGTD
jgi:S1-C subfamily serine protease